MLATPIKAPANPLQVLVCDASYAVRKDLRCALESAFPTALVFEAVDGRAALATMALQRVDLIVTDLGLSASEGQSFLDLLMSNPVLSRKPILALVQPPVDHWQGRYSRLGHLVVLASTSPRQSIAVAARVMLGHDRLELAQAS